jgi:N6-L-threonylcarbamoyladenine synthase/protein kinase Bud32
MICLGIESTAHTFGVGIIDQNGNVLFNKKSIYKPPLGKGIYPREAAKSHSINSVKIIKEALKSFEMEKIDVISFSRGPGLPKCLQIGASIARFLGLKYKKPIIGVNHCIAHIEIGKMLTKCEDPIIVYCSGGNTQIIAFAENKYRIFGETEDIPIGNAFDVLARNLGLNNPGGPEIEKCAKRGKWIDLPYVVKGMDLSFTGIVTECIKKYKEGVKKEDICYSFQETVFSMLTEVTERAMAHTNKKNVLLTGGVAASRRLRKMMKIMCKEREGNCYVVPKEFAGDNGIMISWNGVLAYKSDKITKIKDTGIIKNWRTDEIKITWM